MGQNIKLHKNTIKKMQKKLAKYTESLIMKVYTYFRPKRLTGKNEKRR